MDSQTKDVVIMAHVEALSVLLPVVHDPDGSHVVHDLARLGIEQVAPAIVAPVAASKKKPQKRNALEQPLHETFSLRILGSFF